MQDLTAKAREIRRTILEQVVAFKNGHIASAFSIVEILLVLYYKILRVNPIDPTHGERDRFILSKGHGCSALYAVLADVGFFDSSWLMKPQDGNILGGHPDRLKVPGIEVSTGSLGHGLAIACGMALADRLNQNDRRVYCLLGDGELQEGSVWETALFAGHHQLDNLIVIVDCNRHQSSGAVNEIIDVEPLREKWEAFKWDIRVVNDGHNTEILEETLKRCSMLSSYSNHSPRPHVILAYTQKGKGVSFIEADPKWHTSIPTSYELAEALRELSCETPSFQNSTTSV